MQTLLAKILPLVIALAVAVPFLSVQAGGRYNAKPKQPPKPVYKAISAVDATAHTITVGIVNGTATNEKTFKITDRTGIEVSGQRARFEDLKAGMQVSVDVGMDESTASQITARPAPPEPTPYPTPVPRPGAPGHSHGSRP